MVLAVEPFCNLKSFSNSLLTSFHWFRSRAGEEGEKIECGTEAAGQFGMNGLDIG